MRKPYPTDLTDKQWEFIKPIVDIPNNRGRPRIVDIREIINALFYMNKAGNQWDMLPHDFPAKSTVHYYFLKFSNHGTFI